MNTNFFIDCRRYTTPCKTVLNADTFVVEFLTGKHSIVAKVSNKCYFTSIDNISLSDIKCDFHFSRNYTKPKEFLSNLYDTFDSFLNTTISDNSHLGEKRPVFKNTDEVLDRILEIVTATDSVSSDTKDTIEKELEKLEKELIEPEDTHIMDIKKFKEKSELNENYAVIADEKFHQLTKTLIKSLFKAIGLQDTRKISFTIANDIVFFNYNGTQYKYYPSQCKIFKKRGRKYQRINWKDFANDNSPTCQKQALGRSPPFTPDIRSINIDKFKIKE